MNRSDSPKILLITDDNADEANASHILGKYKFANSLLKLRGSTDAFMYFAAFNTPGIGAREPLPELILMGIKKPDPRGISLLKESRRGPLAGVPLIFLVDSHEEEMEFRKLNLPLSICVTRPMGFFKLLEAMQKLQMRWIVLKPQSP